MYDPVEEMKRAFYSFDDEQKREFIIHLRNIIKQDERKHLESKLADIQKERSALARKAKEVKQQLIALQD